MVTALDKNVSQVVGSAGWRGSAASAFSTSWDRDATASRALGVALDEEGDVVGQLALNLATIEHALESAAQKVEQEGVPVGAGGQPPAARFADATKQQWAQAYQAFWEQCMQAAQQARQQAASSLDGLYTQIGPGARGPDYDKLGQENSLADYVRGLFALPTAYRRLVEAKIPGLRQGAAAARIAARENARGSDGRFGPWSAEDRQAFAGQRTQLASVEQQTANAASHENLLTKALGTGAGDVMDGSEDWGRVGKFFGDIPFASEGLAGVGVGLTIINTRAVLEALFGVETAFARTPKYAIGDRPMNLEVKQYRRRSGWLPYAEIAVGTYFLGMIAFAIDTYNFFAIPFLALFVFGYYWAGFGTLVHEYQGRLRWMKQQKLVAARTA